MDSKKRYEEYSSKLKSLTEGEETNIIEATKLLKKYLANSISQSPDFQNLSDEEKEYILKNTQ